MCVCLCNGMAKQQIIYVSLFITFHYCYVVKITAVSLYNALYYMLHICLIHYSTLG